MNKLEKQGYRLIGNHSAIKICDWTKKSLRWGDNCYKHQFYGINSWRCVQMSCALQYCSHRCNFCWRDLSLTKLNWDSEVDNPKFIVDECIKEFKKILQGFKGGKEINKKRFNEAMKPVHFAISLAGEGTLYPKIGGLIDEINFRNMTSFLVSNGTNPEAIKNLLKHQPTQMYITLPASNEEVYNKVCNPLIENGFEKIKQSLKILPNFNRSVIRLTLSKQNMINPEGYAKILKNLDVKFIEIKAAMSLGYAMSRINYEDMLLHNEIKDFANKIIELTNFKLLDEKPVSRVILLAKKDYKDRKLNVF